MLERCKLLLVLGALALASSANAKDIFVSTSGKDSNSGATPSQALRTFAKAASLAKPGDVVQILPGRYEEPLKPVRSGTTAKPITFRSYGPSPAVITHSKVRGLKSAIDIKNVTDIIIDGIDVDGVKPRPSARVENFVTISNSSRIVIRNGTFRYAHGWHGIGVFDGSSYVTIEKNDLDFVGTYDNGLDKNSDSGDAINVGKPGGASHVLVQNNKVRHGGHNLLAVYGQNCVIQGNYLDNSWRDVIGGDAGGRVAEITGANNVFQGNYLTGAGASSDHGWNTLTKIEGANVIARYNVLHSGNGEGISSSAYVKQKKATQLRIYHNTISRIGGSAWRMEVFDTGMTVGDNAFVNNLVIDSRMNPPHPDSDTDIQLKVAKADLGPTGGALIAGNHFAPARGKKPVIYLFGFDGKVPLDQAQSKYGKAFVANIANVVSGAQAFVNALGKALADFDLTSSSPVRDKAMFLTRAVGSGRSNILKVADSRYFTDGYGLIPGDLIQLQGSSQRVRVVKVDHAKKTLHLAAEVEFKDGQGVTLPYAGKAPDIGAREYGLEGIAPAPPSSVRLAN